MNKIARKVKYSTGGSFQTLVNNYSIGTGVEMLATNSNYINYGDILNFSLSDQFSICISASIEDLSESVLFGKIGANTDGYFVGISANGVGIRQYDHSVTGTNLKKLDVPSTLQTGKVYNWVFSYDGSGSASGQNCYIDAVRLTSVQVEINNALAVSSSADVRLFATNFRLTPTAYINGSCYDLKVYNRVLTQSEINQMHLTNNTVHPTNGLQLSCDFSEKSGIIANDKSGNGYNGTLTNIANTSLGASNQWVDYLGNPIIKY